MSTLSASSWANPTSTTVGASRLPVVIVTCELGFRDGLTLLRRGVAGGVIYVQTGARVSLHVADGPDSREILAGLEAMVARAAAIDDAVVVDAGRPVTGRDA